MYAGNCDSKGKKDEAPVEQHLDPLGRGARVDSMTGQWSALRIVADKGNSQSQPALRLSGRDAR